MTNVKGYIRDTKYLCVIKSGLVKIVNLWFDQFLKLLLH